MPPPATDSSASVKFEYWDDVIRAVQKRNVAVVIGTELLGCAEWGGWCPFYRRLAERTAQVMRAKGIWAEGLASDKDWSSFVRAALRMAGGQWPRITEALDRAHRELLSEARGEDIPEPLRLLAGVGDLDLVLTTTVDGLAAKAFGLGADGARDGGSSRLFCSTMDKSADLADWRPPARGAPPALVHLFGYIGRSHSFALTEEDVLEFMCKLQNEDRPAALLSELRQRQILFLGTQFPDWLARFFIRVLRGVAFSTRQAQNDPPFEALADPEIRSSGSLVAFLQDCSPLTYCYFEGQAADFVRELNERWRSAAPLVQQAKGILMISYAHEDERAALAMRERLEAKGIRVWMDRDRRPDRRDPDAKLSAGDDYDRKIIANIEQCSLFMPLLSRHTRREGYFRREWRHAHEKRLRDIPTGCPFMVPAVVDDSGTGDHKADIENLFQTKDGTVHVIRAPGGLIEESDADEIRLKLIATEEYRR